MKIFLLPALLFINMLSGSAQDLTGLWEGEVNIDNDKSHTLTVQMEIMTGQNGKLLSIVYTRGFEENMMFGCDFILRGESNKRLVTAGLEKIQRHINIPEGSCIYLDQFSAFLSSEDSTLWLKGDWRSLAGLKSSFTCHKVSNELSETAKDELIEYIDGIYQRLDEASVYLDPVERKLLEVASYTTDSSEITFDIRAKNVTGNDSVSIYLNGDTVMFCHNLSVKPLRLRIRLNDDQPNQVVIVSESKLVKELDLSAVIGDGSTNEKNTGFQPGFTVNTVFFVARKRISN